MNQEIMQPSQNEIWLEGELKIRIVEGRNGPFPIGTLTTSLGTFMVKDQIIEQFESGVYKGQFCVTQFFQADFDVPGKKIVEQRVSLSNLLIDEGGENFCEVPSDEPDPVNEKLPQELVHSTAVESKQPSEDDSSDEEEDNRLYEENQVLEAVEEGQETIKLDSTVSRALLRELTTILKKSGYRYYPANREWRRM